jgi:hypothetical protein
MRDINLLKNEIHFFVSKHKVFFNIDNLIILSISSIVFFFSLFICIKEINFLVFYFKLIKEIEWQMER